MTHMDLSYEEARPETCSEMGVDCRSCIEKSAASVAKICPGLSAASAERTFRRMYSSPGCAHMSRAFVSCCTQGGHVGKPVLVAIAAA